MLFPAISSDSELSFDYQWPPSSRPPTRCHCKTPSCRGFLEVGLDCIPSSKKVKEKEEKGKEKEKGEGKDREKEWEKEREREREKEREKEKERDRRHKERERNKEKERERWDSNDDYAGKSRELRSFGRKKGLWKSRSDLTFIVEKFIVNKTSTENSEKTDNNDIGSIVESLNVNEIETKNEDENNGEEKKIIEAVVKIDLEKVEEKEEIELEKNVEDENTNTTEKKGTNDNENGLEKSVKPADTKTPQWLVGKYLRIWWDSNLRFFEAEIGPYNKKTGMSYFLLIIFFTIFFYY
jgi:hypothetical protein